MAERSKAAVLKTARARALGGSNPSPSAKSASEVDQLQPIPPDIRFLFLDGITQKVQELGVENKAAPASDHHRPRPRPAGSSEGDLPLRPGAPPLGSAIPRVMQVTPLSRVLIVWMLLPESQRAWSIRAT